MLAAVDDVETGGQFAGINHFKAAAIEVVDAGALGSSGSKYGVKTGDAVEGFEVGFEVGIFHEHPASTVVVACPAGDGAVGEAQKKLVLASVVLKAKPPSISVTLMGVGSVVKVQGRPVCT